MQLVFHFEFIFTLIGVNSKLLDGSWSRELVITYIKSSARLP